MEKTKRIEYRGVKEIGEKKLVGFRVVCEDMKEFGEEIPKASMKLVERKSEIKHLVEPVNLIGAFKVAEESQDEDGYWSCFEVEAIEDVPEGMVSLTIPKQKYAVLNFKGHSSEIIDVYTDLHQWITDNGYERTPEKWTLEIYSEWSENEDNVDLCDPVK
ncbi:GyrI-like domain-containing protein [Thalassobacillus hwangdonensis]|uniref:GyrI-like domain-containing protein n=1 Tax=Thalassobacillus hwangdonensis TaxID=546108 RepID=A0ABW3L579_9BACI